MSLLGVDARATGGKAICLLDKIPRQEMVDLAVKAASRGFERIVFDDGVRDAFCYYDEHAVKLNEK